MFEGFSSEVVDTGEVALFVRRAGSGPALLLLHGYPQTHVIWHRVAPALARSFTVLVPDLRGYGASEKPPAGPDGAGYDKRTMARDMVGLLRASGFGSAAVVGHDRGGRLAYRMTLDHPDVVERLVTLDIVPTLDTWESLTRPGAAWHWHVLAQPAPLPERMIAAERELVLDTFLDSWSGPGDAITAEARAAYLESWTDDAIRASCDDYRAGATIDLADDRADRDGGRRITCPLLALWGDPTGQRDLLPTWRRWADDVRGEALDCGHFIAEEAPDALLRHLEGFLSGEKGRV